MRESAGYPEGKVDGRTDQKTDKLKTVYSLLHSQKYSLMFPLMHYNIPGRQKETRICQHPREMVFLFIEGTRPDTQGYTAISSSLQAEEQKHYGPTHPTDGRTDGRKDGRTNGHTLLCDKKRLVLLLNVS